MENNKPIHEIKLGAIVASIWNNSKDNNTHFNTTVSRLYKVDDGNWKRTSSFSPSELLLVAKVIDQAHSYIYNELLTKNHSD